MPVCGQKISRWNAYRAFKKRMCRFGLLFVYVSFSFSYLLCFPVSSRLITVLCSFFSPSNSFQKPFQSVSLAPKRTALLWTHCPVFNTMHMSRVVFFCFGFDSLIAAKRTFIHARANVHLEAAYSLIDVLICVDNKQTNQYDDNDSHTHTHKVRLLSN